MRTGVSVTLALVVGAAIAIAAGLSVIAQPASNQSGGDTGSLTAPPPGVPVIQAPPEAPPPSDNGDEDNGGGTKAATNSVKHAAQPPPPPLLSPAAPKPLRSPVAVLQALDKVTAETMRFAVPVGQPVRYKNLVFMVKACETSTLSSQAAPQSSAYVVIDLAPQPAQGISAAGPRQVFKGWMFSNSPGLNPFQHPIYDAWLITCMAAAPAPAGTPPPS